MIDLTNNGIREIAGKTFHKVGNVRRLVLDHNDLIISGPQHHPRIFSNFFNLEQLHLTNAFTETIDSQWYLRDLKNVFSMSNLTKIRKMHLEQNEIWSVNDKDMFCPLVALEELYLGDNQLQVWQKVNKKLKVNKQLTVSKITNFHTKHLCFEHFWH